MAHDPPADLTLCSSGIRPAAPRLALKSVKLAPPLPIAETPPRPCRFPDRNPRTVVGIAQGLDTRTIAEFVGDDATFERLGELGVDFGQDFTSAARSHWIRRCPTSSPGASVSSDPPAEPASLPCR